MASTVFLPDISGFTRFVNQNEIEHSRHIIAEILELLIDSNKIGFELAEIEGDALFYYMHERTPSLEALMSQINQMYSAFHMYLKNFEKRRICQCGACTTAIDLQLKFIVHAGEFDFIEVRGHKKPYGKDVIVAHRLMKNEVPSDEYALLSDGYLNAVSSDDNVEFGSLSPVRGSSSYGEIGAVDYTYLLLEGLKQHLPPADQIELGTKSDNPVTTEYSIDAPLADVFEMVLNLDKRLLWNKGVDGMKWEKNKINRAGTEHTCVVNDKDIFFETVKGDFEDQTHVIGEQTTALPFTKEVTSYFILNEEGDKTNLKVELHMAPSGFIGRMLAPLLGKKVMQNADKTLTELKALMENKN